MKQMIWIGLVIIMIATGVSGQLLTDREKAEEEYQAKLDVIPAVTILSYDVVKNVIVEGEHYVHICYNITVFFDSQREFNNCVALTESISTKELNRYLERARLVAIEDSRPLDVSYPFDRGDLNSK